MGEVIDFGEAKAEIARLAALNALDYDRERRAAAERLEVRVWSLDAAVKAVRDEIAQQQAAAQLRSLITSPEPWPEPVEGAELLDGIEEAVLRFVIMEADQAGATALWILAAHAAFTSFSIFPRLTITSPVKRCGKTTLLDLIGRLTPRALRSESVTTAVVFRLIEPLKPTFLLDEADRYLNRNEELIGVVNAGHRADGVVYRCIGDDHEPTPFSVFCPMAISGIDRPPDTIEDRSIIVELQRKGRDEKVDRLRARPIALLDDLLRKCARWAADHGETLANADTSVPSGLYNRQSDNWEPMFAVADACGGDWPKRARKIATIRAVTDDDDSIRVQLLTDIKDVFEDEDELWSEEIVEGLKKRADSPWPEYGKGGKGLTQRQLAVMLRGFHITPQQVNRGPRNKRGYHRRQFEAAFARYLPADPPVSSACPLGSAEIRASQADFQALAETEASGSKNREKPRISAASSDQAVEKPPTGGRRGKRKFDYRPRTREQVEARLHQPRNDDPPE